MAKKEQDQESLLDMAWNYMKKGTEAREKASKDLLSKEQKENVKGFFKKTKKKD